MCLAIPVKILERKGTKALVEFEGNSTTVDVTLLPDVEIGDYIIVHAGIAIEKYSVEEARKTLDLIAEMNELLDSENKA